MTKIMVIVFSLLTGFAGYFTYYGIGAQSFDVVKSVRNGSVGNVRTYGIK